MSFLPSFTRDATLLDVFKKFPVTSLPLLEYHEALMRGASPLKVADRELIAAYVSGLNGCQYCHGVHAVTAGYFGVSEDLLKALLENPDDAQIDAPMRPLLAFVRKLTLAPSRMSPEDAEQVFAAGWNEQAFHD
ncbi:MAG: carboxymuconolactone decarboxylase family protein, partial [Alphaproteobacteria bacterium]|nr:carboxymuconolactone decarboxylase family protein [Alphaproteobacteria bacterium]